MDTSKLHASSTLTCSPAIDFDVEQLIASPSGHYLLLIGRQSQGSDKAVAAVVDVYGGCIKPQSKVKECTLHHIDPQLYETRPGLAITQASWHPHSESHLAILTSDSRFRLYSLADPTLGEQSFDLSACLSPPTPLLSPAPFSSPLHSSSKVRFGLIKTPQGKGMSNSIVSFSFGPPVSWGFFSVLFLTSSGLIFHLGPVCPFGCKIPSSVLHQAFLVASDSEDSDILTSWLLSAFPSSDDKAFGINRDVLRFKSKPKWTSASYVHEGSTPCLSGPLNSTDQKSTAASRAVSLLCSHHIDYSINLATPSTAPQDARQDQNQPSSTSCVISGHSDGSILVYALHGLLLPRWLDHSSSSVKPNGCHRVSQRPQCVVDSRGSIRAVKYECPLVPFITPGSADSVLSCGSALLLDEIDLQIPPALTSPPKTDSDDDEEEEEESKRSLMLIGCEGRPQSFWAVHKTGCWSIDIPWLPTLSQALSASSSKSHLRGLQAAIDSLPPPSIKELIAPPSEFSPSLTDRESCSSACSLNDLFLGDFVIVLQSSASVGQGLSSERLRCFQQRGNQADQDSGRAKKEATKVTKVVATDARTMLLESNITAIYTGIGSHPSVNLPQPSSECVADRSFQNLTQLSSIVSHPDLLAHRQR